MNSGTKKGNGPTKKSSKTSAKKNTATKNKTPAKKTTASKNSGTTKKSPSKKLGASPTPNYAYKHTGNKKINNGPSQKSKAGKTKTQLTSPKPKPSNQKPNDYGKFSRAMQSTKGNKPLSQKQKNSLSKATQSKNQNTQPKTKTVSAKKTGSGMTHKTPAKKLLGGSPTPNYAYKPNSNRKISTGPSKTTSKTPKQLVSPIPKPSNKKPNDYSKLSQAMQSTKGNKPLSPQQKNSLSQATRNQKPGPGNLGEHGKAGYKVSPQQQKTINAYNTLNKSGSKPLSQQQKNSLSNALKNQKPGPGNLGEHGKAGYKISPQQQKTINAFNKLNNSGTKPLSQQQKNSLSNALKNQKPGPGNLGEKGTLYAGKPVQPKRAAVTQASNTGLFQTAYALPMQPSTTGTLQPGKLTPTGTLKLNPTGLPPVNTPTGDPWTDFWKQSAQITEDTRNFIANIPATLANPKSWTDAYSAQGVSKQFSDMTHAWGTSLSHIGQGLSDIGQGKAPKINGKDAANDLHLIGNALTGAVPGPGPVGFKGGVGGGKPKNIIIDGNDAVLKPGTKESVTFRYTKDPKTNEVTLDKFSGTYKADSGKTPAPAISKQPYGPHKPSSALPKQTKTITLNQNKDGVYTAPNNAVTNKNIWKGNTKPLSKSTRDSLIKATNTQKSKKGNIGEKNTSSKVSKSQQNLIERYNKAVSSGNSKNTAPKKTENPTNKSVKQKLASSTKTVLNPVQGGGKAVANAVTNKFNSTKNSIGNGKAISQSIKSLGNKANAVKGSANVKLIQPVKATGKAAVGKFNSKINNAKAAIGNSPKAVAKGITSLGKKANAVKGSANVKLIQPLQARLRNSKVQPKTSVTGKVGIIQPLITSKPTLKQNFSSGAGASAAINLSNISSKSASIREQSSAPVINAGNKSSNPLSSSIVNRITDKNKKSVVPIIRKPGDIQPVQRSIPSAATGNRLLSNTIPAKPSFGKSGVATPDPKQIVISTKDNNELPLNSIQEVDELLAKRYFEEAQNSGGNVESVQTLNNYVQEILDTYKNEVTIRLDDNSAVNTSMHDLVKARIESLINQDRTNMGAALGDSTQKPLFFFNEVNDYQKIYDFLTHIQDHADRATVSSQLANLAKIESNDKSFTVPQFLDQLKDVRTNSDLFKKLEQIFGKNSKINSKPLHEFAEQYLGLNKWQATGGQAFTDKPDESAVKDNHWNILAEKLAKNEIKVADGKGGQRPLTTTEKVLVEEIVKDISKNAFAKSDQVQLRTKANINTLRATRFPYNKFFKFENNRILSLFDGAQIDAPYAEKMLDVLDKLPADTPVMIANDKRSDWHLSPVGIELMRILLKKQAVSVIDAEGDIKKEIVNSKSHTVPYSEWTLNLSAKDTTLKVGAKNGEYIPINGPLLDALISSLPKEIRSKMVVQVGKTGRATLLTGDRFSTLYKIGNYYESSGKRDIQRPTVTADTADVQVEVRGGSGLIKLKEYIYTPGSKWKDINKAVFKDIEIVGPSIFANVIKRGYWKLINNGKPLDLKPLASPRPGKVQQNGWKINKESEAAQPPTPKVINEKILTGKPPALAKNVATKLDKLIGSGFAPHTLPAIPAILVRSQDNERLTVLTSENIKTLLQNWLGTPNIEIGIRFYSIIKKLGDVVELYSPTGKRLINGAIDPKVFIKAYYGSSGVNQHLLELADERIEQLIKNYSGDEIYARTVAELKQEKAPVAGFSYGSYFSKSLPAFPITIYRPLATEATDRQYVAQLLQKHFQKTWGNQQTQQALQNSLNALNAGESDIAVIDMSGAIGNPALIEGLFGLPLYTEKLPPGVNKAVLNPADLNPAQRLVLDSWVNAITQQLERAEGIPLKVTNVRINMGPAAAVWHTDPDYRTAALVFNGETGTFYKDVLGNEKKADVLQLMVFGPELEHASWYENTAGNRHRLSFALTYEPANPKWRMQQTGNSWLNLKKLQTIQQFAPKKDNPIVISYSDLKPVKARDNTYVSGVTYADETLSMNHFWDKLRSGEIVVNQAPLVIHSPTQNVPINIDANVWKDVIANIRNSSTTQEGLEKLYASKLGKDLGLNSNEDKIKFVFDGAANEVNAGLLVGDIIGKQLSFDNINWGAIGHPKTPPKAFTNDPNDPFNEGGLFQIYIKHLLNAAGEVVQFKPDAAKLNLAKVKFIQKNGKVSVQVDGKPELYDAKELANSISRGETMPVFEWTSYRPIGGNEALEKIITKPKNSFVQDVSELMHRGSANYRSLGYGLPYAPRGATVEPGDITNALKQLLGDGKSVTEAIETISSEIAIAKTGFFKINGKDATVDKLQFLRLIGSDPALLGAKQNAGFAVFDTFLSVQQEGKINLIPTAITSDFIKTKLIEYWNIHQHMDLALQRLKSVVRYEMEKALANYPGAEIIVARHNPAKEAASQFVQLRNAADKLLRAELLNSVNPADRARANREITTWLEGMLTSEPKKIEKAKGKLKDYGVSEQESEATVGSLWFTSSALDAVERALIDGDIEKARGTLDDIARNMVSSESGLDPDWYQARQRYVAELTEKIKKLTDIRAKETEWSPTLEYIGGKGVARPQDIFSVIGLGAISQTGAKFKDYSGRELAQIQRGLNLAPIAAKFFENNVYSKQEGKLRPAEEFYKEFAQALAGSGSLPSRINRAYQTVEKKWAMQQPGKVPLILLGPSIVPNKLEIISLDKLQGAILPPVMKQGILDNVTQLIFISDGSTALHKSIAQLSNELANSLSHGENYREWVDRNRSKFPGGKVQLMGANGMREMDVGEFWDLFTAPATKPSDSPPVKTLWQYQKDGKDIVTVDPKEYLLDSAAAIGTLKNLRTFTLDENGLLNEAPWQKIMAEGGEIRQLENRYLSKYIPILMSKTLEEAPALFFNNMLAQQGNANREWINKQLGKSEQFLVRSGNDDYIRIISLSELNSFLNELPNISSNFSMWDGQPFAKDLLAQDLARLQQTKGVQLMDRDGKPIDLKQVATAKDFDQIKAGLQSQNIDKTAAWSENWREIIPLGEGTSVRTTAGVTSAEMAKFYQEQLYGTDFDIFMDRIHPNAASLTEAITNLHRWLSNKFESAPLLLVKGNDQSAYLTTVDDVYQTLGLNKKFTLDAAYQRFLDPLNGNFELAVTNSQGRIVQSVSKRDWVEMLTKALPENAFDMHNAASAVSENIRNLIPANGSAALIFQTADGRVKSGLLGDKAEDVLQLLHPSILGELTHIHPLSATDAANLFFTETTEPLEVDVAFITNRRGEKIKYADYLRELKSVWDIDLLTILRKLPSAKVGTEDVPPYFESILLPAQYHSHSDITAAVIGIPAISDKSSLDSYVVAYTDMDGKEHLAPALYFFRNVMKIIPDDSHKLGLLWTRDFESLLPVEEHQRQLKNPQATSDLQSGRLTQQNLSTRFRELLAERKTFRAAWEALQLSYSLNKKNYVLNNIEGTASYPSNAELFGEAQNAKPFSGQPISGNKFIIWPINKWEMGWASRIHIIDPPSLGIVDPAYKTGFTSLLRELPETAKIGLINSGGVPKWLDEKAVSREVDFIIRNHQRAMDAALTSSLPNHIIANEKHITLGLNDWKSLINNVRASKTTAEGVQHLAKTLGLKQLPSKIDIVLRNGNINSVDAGLFVGQIIGKRLTLGEINWSNIGHPPSPAKALFNGPDDDADVLDSGKANAKDIADDDVVADYTTQAESLDLLQASLKKDLSTAFKNTNIQQASGLLLLKSQVLASFYDLLLRSKQRSNPQVTIAVPNPEDVKAIEIIDIQEDALGQTHLAVNIEGQGKSTLTPYEALLMLATPRYRVAMPFEQQIKQDSLANPGRLQVHVAFPRNIGGTVQVVTAKLGSNELWALTHLHDVILSSLPIYVARDGQLTLHNAQSFLKSHKWENGWVVPQANSQNPLYKIASPYKTFTKIGRDKKIGSFSLSSDDLNDLTKYAGMLYLGEPNDTKVVVEGQLMYSYNTLRYGISKKQLIETARSLTRIGETNQFADQGVNSLSIFKKIINEHPLNHYIRLTEGDLDNFLSSFFRYELPYKLVREQDDLLRSPFFKTWRENNRELADEYLKLGIGTRENLFTERMKEGLVDLVQQLPADAKELSSDYGKKVDALVERILRYAVSNEQTTSKIKTRLIEELPDLRKLLDSTKSPEGAFEFAVTSLIQKIFGMAKYSGNAVLEGSLQKIIFDGFKKNAERQLKQIERITEVLTKEETELLKKEKAEGLIKENVETPINQKVESARLKVISTALTELNTAKTLATIVKSLVKRDFPMPTYSPEILLYNADRILDPISLYEKLGKSAVDKDLTPRVLSNPAVTDVIVGMIRSGHYKIEVPKKPQASVLSRGNLIRKDTVAQREAHSNSNIGFNKPQTTTKTIVEQLDSYRMSSSELILSKTLDKGAAAKQPRYKLDRDYLVNIVKNQEIIRSVISSGRFQVYVPSSKKILDGRQTGFFSALNGLKVLTQILGNEKSVLLLDTENHKLYRARASDIVDAAVNYWEITENEHKFNILEALRNARLNNVFNKARFGFQPYSRDGQGANRRGKAIVVIPQEIEKKLDQLGFPQQKVDVAALVQSGLLNMPNSEAKSLSTNSNQKALAEAETTQDKGSNKEQVGRSIQSGKSATPASLAFRDFKPVAELRGPLTLYKLSNKGRLPNLGLNRVDSDR